MAAKLRMGVIGCGFYAQNHLNAWRDLGTVVELAAVCDVDPAKTKTAAAKFGVPKTYNDARQMLETEKLDFVDIVTTMPTHHQLVLLAASLKTPAIVQKPFAPTWAECIEMVAVYEKAGLPLMVHENFR